MQDKGMRQGARGCGLGWDGTEMTDEMSRQTYVVIGLRLWCGQRGEGGHR